MADDLDDTAVSVAAKETGLRPDQIEHAVKKYRAALNAAVAEPQWQALNHMCGRTESYATYVDASGDSQIVMSVNSRRTRGEEWAWKQEQLYSVFGKTYETFAEARKDELLKLATFSMKSV